MRGHLEVEHKIVIDPTVFTRYKFMKLLKDHPETYAFMYAAGPDYYASNGTDSIRFRSSRTECFQELTVKTRVSNKTTTVRNEIDLKLSGVKDETVHQFLNLLNFNHVFTLVKHCDIFYLENKAGHKYTVVYYKVWDKKNRDKKHTFIEIEGDKNLTKKQSLKVINSFKKFLEQKQLINSSQLSKESLYEIFSREK